MGLTEEVLRAKKHNKMIESAGSTAGPAFLLPLGSSMPSSIRHLAHVQLTALTYAGK